MLVGTAGAAALALAAVSPAHAALTVSAGLGTDTFKTEPGQGIPTGVGGFVNGTVTATASEYRFTYLGAGNAFYINQFFVDNDTNPLNGFLLSFCNSATGCAGGVSQTAVGTSVDLLLGAGNVPFYFYFEQGGTSGGPHTLVNGGTNTSTGAYLAQIGLGTTPNGGPGPVAYIGLSDECYGVNCTPLRDSDFQDLTLSVAEIPEPSTWALMLAGLGLLGFMAKRRLN